MLMLTQLSGFGANSVETGFNVRRLGVYTYSFSASSTATMTIVNTDLGQADSSRQILILGSTELNEVQTMTVDGVLYTPIISGYFTTDSAAWGFPYPTNTASVSITLTAGAAITEAGSMIAFEVYGARPLCEAYRKAGGEAGGIVYGVSLVALTGNIIKGINSSQTDTATTTWTGLTEVSDADVGTYALSDATATVASDYLNTAISANTSAGASDMVVVGIQPHTQLNVRGGYRALTTATISSTTATFVSPQLPTRVNGVGSGESVLAIFVEGDSTISGVTWNGVSMTSRGSATNTAATPDLTVGFFSLPFTQASPSGNIVVTLNNASSNGLIMTMAQYALYGVSSYGTATSANGSSVGTTTNASVQKDGFLLIAVCRGTSGDTVTTGVDTDVDLPAGAYEAVTGSRLMSATNASYAAGHTGPSSQWQQVLLPVNP